MASMDRHTVAKAAADLAVPANTKLEWIAKSRPGGEPSTRCAPPASPSRLVVAQVVTSLQVWW